MCDSIVTVNSDEVINFQDGVLHHENPNITKKRRGRPRVEHVEPVKRERKHKYKLFYENNEYLCYTIREIAKITEKSPNCIFRIIDKQYKNKIKNFNNIKITRIVENTPEQPKEQVKEMPRDQPKDQLNLLLDAMRHILQEGK